MLSKAKAKLVQSLKDKKQRYEQRLFVAEGAKIVLEALASKITVKTLFATEQWLDLHRDAVHKVPEVIVLQENEVKQGSLLQTPQGVAALCEMPAEKPVFSPAGLTLVLDTIQDPGNLGTILRTADWYGIRSVVCSKECADVYNPKVIQATMGAFLRVQVFEKELLPFFEEHKEIPVYGALMSGRSLYETRFSDPAFLLIGNEGSGISEALQPRISHPITIPRRGAAESLNAAIASAVICDAWARQQS